MRFGETEDRLGGVGDAGCDWGKLGGVGSLVEFGYIRKGIFIIHYIFINAKKKHPMLGCATLDKSRKNKISHINRNKLILISEMH